MGHGAQKVFGKFNVDKRVVSVIGDSTFFHTGINSLIDVAFNQSNTVTVILDNRITGMTGHQQNPGTGFTLMGEPANEINIPDLVAAIGIKHIVSVNPLHLDEMNKAIDDAFAFDGPAVIITRWPCVLKQFTESDLKEFDLSKKTCYVDVDACKGCKICTKTGCPAISFDKETKKASIDANMCVGCQVCLQACPFKAIKKVGE